MGFFSDVFKDSGGAIVSSALGAVGGLIGNSQKQAFAREQLQYQQDLHRNQIQWRVEDAKRAGVHPMAALGLSSMSFSPVSSPDYDNWLGEIGQNIDRAIQQGKTRKEREQAQFLQDRLTNMQIRRGEAEADLAETEAAAARFRLQQQLFPAPPPTNGATGIISGQGDLPVAPPKEGYIGEPEIQFNPTAHDPNVFTMNAGNDVTSLWEDKDIAGVIPLDLWPIIKANFIDYASRLRGKVVNGMVYDNARRGWVSVNGPYGKAALADHLGIGNFFGGLGKRVSKVINPFGREKFDPQEYARRFYTF